MNQGSRVTRLLKIVQLLQSGRDVEPDRLATTLKVSKRTVFRDLKVLDEAGVGFRFSRRTQAYAPREEPLLPPTHLTPAEALALLTLIRQGLAQRSTPSPRDAASAAMKLESLLPRRLQDYCGPMLARTEFLPSQESRADTAADRLLYFQRAIALGLKVEAEYHSLSPREVVTSVLHAYRLFHAQRGWYLIAFSEHHGQTRMFKLNRFTRLKSTQEEYKVDPAFSLEAYLGSAWSLIREDQTHLVQVRFEPMVADNVAEIRWHAGQRVRRQPDGGIIFEVDVDGLREISWWILGYGDQATVLEPPELREMIAERVRGMAERYGISVASAAVRGA
ncbi:MAG: WYL domain-containing transcriptional regulator [Phycisphaerales bacterium]|nr:WYL domain-containing transcriptional regulator [Phycisphaerales bacterium]